MSRPSFNSRSSGFTLIEVLIASSIFSIISIAAFAGFRVIERSKNAQEYTQNQLTELERTFLILGQDLTQMVPRAISDELGGERRPIELSNYNGTALEFSRLGWINPAPETLPARSEIQRVAYTANDGKLQRVSWYQLDRMVEGGEITRTLLKDVDALRWRFLDGEREWQETWPPSTADPSAPFPMPVAVQAIVEHKTLGDLSRLYVVTD